MSAAIELRGVEKNFGEVKIIRDINLSVAQGERHALIGPNGAGKSTTFNLISGYMAPTSGSVLLRGEVISGLPPYQINRRGLSRSFQVTNVFANMSVWENLRCAVLWATGPAPHPLLAASGFALGPTGAVRVDAALQSTSHPNVFAAGDCADLPTAAPKSGVYSVREAPALGHNLLAALRGEPLRLYTPQRRALALLNCGDGTALLSWGRLSLRGRWVRRWKHRLDVGFLESLRHAAQRTIP